MPVIPKKLLTPCTMKRVICHWSEGNYKANSTDSMHYHILIEGDGTVRGGDHLIIDNVSTGDDNYAAHTQGANTGSVGVACCCMAGCKESPFGPGSQPMKQSQWDVMIQVVAELCRFYKIPVTPTTVLGHGEVQKNLGIKQKGKWDPMVWPWDTSKTRAQVGAALREQVSAALGGVAAPVVPVVPVVPVAPVAPVAPAESPPAIVATPVGNIDSYTLRSPLLAGDPVMGRIATTTLVLVQPQHAEPVAGIGVVQEAINRLASAGVAVPRITFGKDGKYRGWFGSQTADALRVFQRLAGIGADGKIGDDTLRALDGALVKAGAGGLPSDGQAIPAPLPQPLSPPVVQPVSVPAPAGATAGVFKRPAAASRTRDGAGSSSTTGLKGSIEISSTGVETVVASEELAAKRDNKSLGSPRVVSQRRTTDPATGQTIITQSDYCWSTRKLPDAVVFTNHAGFKIDSDVIEGEASYFGKFDTMDEGTGTPVFGVVQTNSSVFGISLAEPILIKLGLARREGAYLQKTDLSHSALIEVYYPKTRRLARVPIVDVGPKASLNRPADLTVAVAAFLHNSQEEKAKAYKLSNIQVLLRLV